MRYAKAAGCTGPRAPPAFTFPNLVMFHQVPTKKLQLKVSSRFKPRSQLHGAWFTAATAAPQSTLPIHAGRLAATDRNSGGSHCLLSPLVVDYCLLEITRCINTQHNLSNIMKNSSHDKPCMQ